MRIRDIFAIAGVRTVSPLNRAAIHAGAGMARARTVMQSLLEAAGVQINGPNPWDLQVRDTRFYRRALMQGSLGVGESYMDGHWDSGELDEMFFRIFRAAAEESIAKRRKRLLAMQSLLINMQSPRRAFTVGRKHYDIGDDLYSRMLDPRMIYSCAYWKQAETLEAAQEAKLDLVAPQVPARRRMRVLDIGCGWGGAAQFAAERYGVRGHRRHRVTQPTAMAPNVARTWMSKSF